MFLAIEIGGTKLQLGIGHSNGVLHGLWRGTIVPGDGADGIRRQIVAAVPQLLEKSPTVLRGVGVGFGGPVDDERRCVITSHQIAGWDGFPLADWIGDLLGLPTVIGNDADVAGLGEATFGAGRGFSPVFYITIGSGIGGGLIIDSQIHRGTGKGAAEIGHLRVPIFENGQVRYTILEHVTSGWGLQETVRQQRRASAEIEAFWRTVQGDAPSLTAAHIAEAARRGETIAVTLLHNAWQALAEAICQVIALVCPRRIVIGGGVSLMGDVLFSPLRRLVAERVFRPLAAEYEIVQAALGEEVVLHGALELARRRLVPSA